MSTVPGQGATVDILALNKLSGLVVQGQVGRVVFQTTHERHYVDVLFLLTPGCYYNGWNSFPPWNLNKCLCQRRDE